MRLIAMTALALGACVLGRPGAASAATPCSALAQMKIDQVNLLSSVQVRAGDGLPAYCRVLGYVRPAINFEVRLPITDWNGKFYEAGCGGFCGTLDTGRPGMFNSITYAERRNYAVATMDSGHWGSGVTDGRWAFDNPVAKADWAWRAVSETARVGKELVRAFYAQAPQHAYFNGCSTGGRMAGIEATRFPGDFDGIIMGAPALDYTSLVATFFAWLTQANTSPDGHLIFKPEHLPLVVKAVRAACAGPDGLVDDPRTCAFRPQTLLCQPDSKGDCLSAAEVGVLEAWYNGPRDVLGRKLYPGGLPPGSEANWGLWLTGIGGHPPVMPLFARDFLRYMAFEPDAGPAYDISDFDFDRDPVRLLPMAALYNVVTWIPGGHPRMVGADLHKFAARGGKMIIWHGWGDPLVTPWLTMDWYIALAQRAGGFAKLSDTARLFMIPGMDHCGINPNNGSITDTGLDPLTALEGWVEHGSAPDTLLATKRNAAGKTLWQRPVCAFPLEAKLASGADPALPTSWACAPE